MHLIIDPGTKDIYSARSIKNLKSCLQQRGINFRAQKVKSIDRIFVYLQTPPRVMIGCNNLRMMTWITQTESQQVLFPQKDMKDILEDIEPKLLESTSSDFMESLMKITNDSSMMSLVQDPPLNFEEA